MEKVSRSLAAILLLTAALAPAQNNNEGVIAGSVFRDSGLSLPGAKVTVTPVAASNTEGKKKPKVVKTQTDSRGEFAVRVPAGAVRYDVSVEADGYEPETKQAQVEWKQRVDLFFRLQAAKK